MFSKEKNWWGPRKLPVFCRQKCPDRAIGVQIHPLQVAQAKNIEKVPSKWPPGTNFERHAGREHEF